MDEEMEVRILGPVALSINDRLVDAGPPLQRAVLAALAVDVGRALSDEELTNRLWGEKAPSTARKGLQKYVSQLRRLLGAEAIVRVGHGYRLDLQPAQIDARSVELELDDVRKEPDPSARLDRLDRALARFRGEPLAEIETHFAILERARLSDLRLVVAEERAVTMLAGGQFESAIAWTAELLADFPFRERLWEISMRALYGAGRQADALSAYQRLRRNLADELGIEPSPPLRALEHRLLTQDPTLATGGLADAALSSHLGPVEERRIVSLVAARPSATSSVLDIDQVVDRLGRLAEQHGGRLVEAEGAAIAAFGMPTHEDDPVRAATAALELMSACDVVCSVTSGETLLVDNEGPLRLAAAMVTRAVEALDRSSPPMVAIDQPSAAALDGSTTIHCSPSGVLSLESVRIGLGHDHAGPFIGRGGEAQRLIDIWQACVEGGDNQLVTLLGDGGLGKSRLLAEVANRFGSEPPRWLQTTCVADRDGAFSPIVRLFRLVFGPEPAAQIDRRLAEAGIAASEAAWLRNHASLLFDDDPQPGSDRVERLRAWARLLAVAVGSSGAIVALDDMHLASQPLIEFVEEILDQPDGPLLVICAGRPKYIEGLTSIRTDKPSTGMTLGPLDAHSSRQLVSALLGDGSADGLPANLAERSGGNPFFIHELTRVAMDSNRKEFPSSVRIALVARIDSAGLLARFVLQAMSVIGEPVGPELLSAALDLPTASVHQPLADLRRHRLVTTVVGEPGLFQVAHSLIGEVAAQLVTPERRLLLHDSAASWYRQSGGSVTLELLERKAYHAEEAYRVATELRSGEGDHLARRAGQTLVELGTRLASIDASRCLQILETALARIEPGTTDWARAALDAGRAATDRGEWLRVDELLAQSILAFHQHGDRRGEASARVALDIKRQLRGEEEVGVETARALEIIGDLPGPELANALSRQLAIKAVSGDVEGTISLGDSTHDLIEAHGTPEDRARALNATAIARLELGDRDALHQLETTLDLCLQEGLTRQATSAYNNLGNNTWAHRGPGGAIPILHDAIGFARDRGHEYMAFFSTSTLAEVLFDGGRWGEALATAKKLMNDRDGLGYSRAGDMAGNIAGLIHLWQGRIDDASHLLTSASLDRARTLGDLQQLGPWLVASAMLATATGERDRAAELLVEMGQATVESERWRCAVTHEAVRVAISIDRIDVARQLIVLEPQPVRRAELSRLSALALLIHAEGDPSAALIHYRSARDGWDRFGSPLEAGLVGFDEARCLREVGQQPDAAASANLAGRRLLSLGVDLTQVWWQLADRRGVRG